MAAVDAAGRDLRTVVLDDPSRVRAVFEQLLAGNLHLGRPEHIEIIFGRKVTAHTLPSPSGERPGA